MKTKKMSLATMQGKLSRTEMKNVMAGGGDDEGDEGGGAGCPYLHMPCSTDQGCKDVNKGIVCCGDGCCWDYCTD